MASVIDISKKQNGNLFCTKRFPFHPVVTVAATKCQVTVIVASSSKPDPFESCFSESDPDGSKSQQPVFLRMSAAEKPISFTDKSAGAIRAPWNMDSKNRIRQELLNFE